MEDVSSCYAENALNECSSEYENVCDETCVKKTKCSENSFGNVSIPLKLFLLSSYGFYTLLQYLALNEPLIKIEGTILN